MEVPKSSNVRQIQPIARQMPSQTFLMMAAQMMHGEGRLITPDSQRGADLPISNRGRTPPIGFEEAGLSKTDDSQMNSDMLSHLRGLTADGQSDAEYNRGKTP